MCKDSRVATSAIKQRSLALSLSWGVNPDMGKPQGWDMTMLPALFPLYRSDVYAQKPQPENIFYSSFVLLFLLKFPRRSLCQGRVILCMEGSWDSCSEEPLQTIIGKGVKHAVDLLY